ncbi:MAG TPA: hypothetical protein DEP72_04770 [Clostridiales bacterium]|nr:MAG: hypothetical protein A2Y18_05565 [Clostridiales bacterium GWD2_32_19]HCC07455.1 hypothetical protein [Clostridiales bacterium]
MIDLHVHSTYSDGCDNVETLLKHAEKNKLEVIAITDHNTIEAYKYEILDYKKYFTGRVITGCEVSTILEKDIIEILGYKIDVVRFDKFLKQYFSDERKLEILKKGLEFLYRKADEKGLKCDKVAYETLKSSDILTRLFNWEIAKHPENKSIYMQDAWENNTIFIRNYLSNPSSEWFIDNSLDYPSTKEVIDEIHKAGGLAFVAHPLEYSVQNIYDILDKIKKMGIDGIEIFHLSANIERRKGLIKYAEQNNLYMSGGSDYHRIDHPLKHSLVGDLRFSLVIEKNIIKSWINEV